MLTYKDLCCQNRSAPDCKFTKLQALPGFFPVKSEKGPENCSRIGILPARTGSFDNKTHDLQFNKLVKLLI